MAGLDPNLVLPPAQLIFINDMALYCGDQLYGTNRCAKTLAQITAEALLILGASNNTCTTTANQQNCFLALINTIVC